MIKPYYNEDGITIYNADCRDVLPQLEPVDLVLTDPPYPGLKGNLDRKTTAGVSARRTPTIAVGTPWGEDLSPLKDAWRLAKSGMLVFCSFHSAHTLPALIETKPVGLVTWYKRNSMPPVRNVPHYLTEFIWAFKKDDALNWRNLKTFYDIPLLQAGCMATERLTDNGGAAVHPAQKPLLLIKKLLMIGCGTVLDPYVGTGTTLRAAKDLGLKSIGIELERKYCDIAVERLRQRSLFSLPELEQAA